MQDFDDIALLLDSGVPLLVLETHDEPAALMLLTRVAMRRRASLYQWTITEGLVRVGAGAAADNPAREPLEVLRAARSLPRDSLLVLCDFHPYLREAPEVVRLLKDIVQAFDSRGIALVLVSHALDIPPELQRLSARLGLRLPDDRALSAIVREEIAGWQSAQQGARADIDPAALKQLVRNLRGLTERDARQLARRAIHDDGAITAADLPALNRAKFALLDLDGIVHFEFDTGSMADVGGLYSLKDWLALRRNAFLSAARDAADYPRGVLLTGAQGAGKSMAARAVAGLWQVPLLRLDVAGLYNKFIGETERQLREALALAERMAPCVLWLDEIEKALATGGGDDGTSRRVLGALLTWLAEHRARVFVVATANEVASLPPELLRKGRFDEIFFVDLPDQEVRARILAIHLQRRGQDPARFDLLRLAAAADGFSGAELEQAVVSCIYQAAAGREPLNDELLLAQLQAGIPLSVSMAERVAALRAWGRERALSAG
ncbi:MAG: AAA family ATPase [Spongiibacteraceae bacterium]|jgi:hypothetical protein|nr:AAA family ATPase [Spongiibacteraceae bacterium]